MTIGLHYIHVECSVTGWVRPGLPRMLLCLVDGNPVFKICNQLRHNPPCSATNISVKQLELLYFLQNYGNKDSNFPANQIRFSVDLPVRGKGKKQTDARWPHAYRTSIRDVIVLLQLRYHVASKRIQDFFSGSFFHVFLV